MMDTDDVTLLGLQLATNAALASEVARSLRELHATRSYTAWAAGAAQSRPFPVPSDIDISPLSAVGLLTDGTLHVKVNAFHDRIFVTDGVWVDPRIRVFPFSDESELLVQHARSENLHGWAVSVVDLATGCGHNAIALPASGPCVAFDVNPRALAYLAVNRALNGVRPAQLSAALNDIRDGIAPVIARGIGERTLFLANMPFALSPDATAMPLTSNGGQTGADLQLAAFAAVQRFAEEASGHVSIRALFLSVTLGAAGANRWQTVEQARRCFGAERVRWHLLNEEKLLRVNGVRELANPVALRIAAPRIASCRLYTPDNHRRARLQDAYAKLADAHEAQGNPDVAFGIIDVNLHGGGRA